MSEPLPIIRGFRITRAEVIEAHRSIYGSLVKIMRESDPTFRGYPDYETVLNHVEQHGLPPKD